MCSVACPTYPHVSSPLFRPIEFRGLKNALLATTFAALALVSTVGAASVASVQPTASLATAPVVEIRPVPSPIGEGPESVAIYYSPLSSTEVSRFAGFGLAYHMAIVYTDASGKSFGASSGPSNLGAAQTAQHALAAFASAMTNAPSAFGTLVSDPHNDTAFVRGSAADYYTQDAQHHPYPSTVVVRSSGLAKQWRSIVQTYNRVGALGLTYSPITQNSNSLAATALRRAGLTLQFSSSTKFAPGVFTQLPLG